MSSRLWGSVSRHVYISKGNKFMSGYSHQRRSTFVTTWISEKFLNFQSLFDFRIMVSHWAPTNTAKWKHRCTRGCAELFLTAKNSWEYSWRQSVEGWVDKLGYICQKSELDFYVLPPKDDLSVVDEKTSHRKNVCGISPFKKEGGYLLFMHVCALWGGRALEACTPNWTLVISGGMGFGRT